MVVSERAGYGKYNAGLIAIKKCGGVTVVQDPKDSAYPQMPQSALNNSHIDQCVPCPQWGIF